MRHPLPLPQADASSCYANVVAQVRWMFGTSNLTGRRAVRDVDRLTGRRRRRAAVITAQLALLAREGYHIADYTGPQVDVTRLRREGASYIQYLDGPYWGGASAEWWTAERVAWYVRECERMGGLYAQWWHRIDLTQERCTAGRVAEAVTAGAVMIVLLRNGTVDSTHAALVYEYSAGRFGLYVPRVGGAGLETWPAERLAEVLTPYGHAVTRPVSAAWPYAA